MTNLQFVDLSPAGLCRTVKTWPRKANFLSIASNKLGSMVCPLCQRRKSRRECPALRQSICAVCCGTKRLVEINCPETCVHLSAARANPPAMVRRQNEADLALLLPTIQKLTERQHQLFFLFQSVIARHRPSGFARLVDRDVAEAVASVAATLETAAKGLIYEHPAQTVVASALAAELSALIQQIRAEGATVYDREAAMALRAIEQGAQTIGGAAGGGDAYLNLLGRLLQVNRAAESQASGSAPSSIILP